MNLREVYQLSREDSEVGTLARQMLDQQHWLTTICEFDPRTGEALPLGLGALLHRLATRESTTYIRDRLWRLVEHSRESVQRLLRSLSEDPRREQAVLPIRAVRELNATSFIALSRRPGRNVREKLAGKPYMQAVRRYQSVDLPQNRLLKEFATQLADLLEMRHIYLGHEDALAGDIRRWLRSEEALAISRWDNLPPNNTLLSHRDYRRVWDSWRWLQSLDEDMDRDFNQIEDRAETVARWEGLVKAYSEGRTIFGDMPVLFEYDNFTIEPWSRVLTRRTTSANRPLGQREAVAQAACVDLSYLRPRYSSSGDAVTRILEEAFLWQHWANDQEAVDLELFDSDAVVLHHDATTLTSADLFLARGAGGQLLQSAAHAFARKLSTVFTSPDLVWLIPDALNDFELQVARRNINARFAHAEPLPRSVAAVFEHVDHSRIPYPGYQVVIVDSFGGTVYATKLIAGYDSELEERVPTTRGFYWERIPHVQINETECPSGPSNEIPFFDGDGEWFDAVPPQRLNPIDERMLRAHPQIGGFDVCVTLAESPVVGGIRLHDLKPQAGDFSLWRDQVPELSIKVFKGGLYQPFFLVNRETTIRPLRGVPVEIPVNDRFILPAGRAYYQFPLFQGQDPDDLGYVASLESPQFPLVDDVTCRLTITYTYGADDPYRLLFEPLDGSFKPVRAKWQPKTETVVTDAPAPEYPTPQTWSELRAWRDAQGEEVDLLSWLEDSLGRLLERIPDRKSRIIVSSAWSSRVDRNGVPYWSATAVADGGAKYRCDSKNFFPRFGGDPNHSFPVGTALFAILESDWARKISVTDGMTTDEKQKIQRFRERSLQNRIATIWSDSRSLSDSDCPPDFRAVIESRLDELGHRLPNDLFKQKMNVLFAFMHKDAPRGCVDWVCRQVDSGAITDPRAVGSSLGSLELPWQRRAFSQLLSRQSRSAISALSYAIWRDQGLIGHFTLHDLQSVLKSIRRILEGIEPFTPRENDKYGRGTWTRGTAEPLELLLGLLRTRSSTDEQTRMLLQPHQDLTKILADDVERVAKIVATSRVAVHSRVQIDNLPPKAEGDRTPDLLYALRLYLTGDVGANTIRVTGVNEDD